MNPNAETLDFDKMDPQVPIENWIVMEYSSVEFYDKEGRKLTSKKDPERRKKREVHSYRLPTREGDWNTRLFVQEGKMIELLQKKWDNNGQYFNIKSMYRDFLTPAYMDPHKEEIHYGRVYQIYNDAVPTSYNPEVYSSTKKGIYLSAVLSLEQLKYQHLCEVEDNCQLLGSTVKKSQKRNTFVLEKEGDPTFDGKLQFNDNVYIRIAHTPKRLYVKCVNFNAATFDYSKHPHVFLSSVQDRYCIFKVIAQDPAQPLFRDDNLIWFILPRTKLLLAHVVSGRYLAAEYPRWQTTWFGPELHISCTMFTKLDGCEKVEHQWRLKSGPDEEEQELDPLAAIQHLATSE